MYVVTGGAGFIGSAVVSRLNQEGINDIIIVDHLATSAKWENLIGKDYHDYIPKDEFLGQLEDGRFKARITAVIHMGACSSTTEDDGDYLMSNNFKYSVRLAQYCTDNNARFIYASSAATYGDGNKGYSDDDREQASFRPLNRYGYSKQLFDLWVLRNGFEDEVAGLKFFNVYGPNEYHKQDMCSVINKAYHQIKSEGTVKLFKSYKSDYLDGEQKRDFIYVKDCVDVIWWLLEHDDVNGIFNLGTGEARTWNDLVKATFGALELEPNIEYIDMPEKLRNQYQYFTQAEMDKLRRAGYDRPIQSLEDGVRDYVVNYLEQPIPYL